MWIFQDDSRNSRATASIASLVYACRNVTERSCQSGCWSAEQIAQQRAQALGVHGLLGPLVGHPIEELAGARGEGSAGEEDHPRRMVGEPCRELIVQLHPRHLWHHQVTEN